MGISLLVSACGLSVMGFEPDATSEAEAGTVEASSSETGGHPIDASDPVDASDAADVVVDTGPPPCATSSIACCGTAPCPAGSTECIDGKCYATLTASGNIDGADELHLQGATMRWRHASFQEPTGLKVNGAGWSINFPNNYSGDICNGCFSDPKSLDPPMAAHPQSGVLTARSGRDTVELQPATAANGNTLVLLFYDPSNSDSAYSATIKYETR